MRAGLAACARALRAQGSAQRGSASAACVAAVLVCSSVGPGVQRLTQLPALLHIPPCAVADAHAGVETELRARGRHDACVVPRAVPMVEAMVALVLADQMMQHYAQCELLPRDGSSSPDKTIATQFAQGKVAAR